MIKLLLKYHYSRISKKAAGLSGFLLSAACFGQAGIQPLTSQMPNNSKYSEFFPGDTLRQIGTVLLNTKTERVFQFAGDTITFYTGVYNQKTGRWLSTDPLFKSYPYASPYHYANNRPTSCIDIEGLAGVDVNGGTDPPNPPVFTIGLFGQLSISNKGFSFTGGIGGQISMKGFSAALNLTNAGKGRAVSVNAFCTVNSMATVGMSYNFP
ncbi:MAG TPA: hypothetical protein VHL77_08350, partial [Ferruginibacter sp.]|nr:hypothetical protein [Ferruginibacter sp.]